MKGSMSDISNLNWIWPTEPPFYIYDFPLYRQVNTWRSPFQVLTRPNIAYLANTRHAANHSCSEHIGTFYSTRGSARAITLLWLDVHLLLRQVHSAKFFWGGQHFTITVPFKVNTCEKNDGTEVSLVQHYDASPKWHDAGSTANLFPVQKIYANVV